MWLLLNTGLLFNYVTALSTMGKAIYRNMFPLHPEMHLQFASICNYWGERLKRKQSILKTDEKKQHSLELLCHKSNLPQTSPLI